MQRERREGSASTVAAARSCLAAAAGGESVHRPGAAALRSAARGIPSLRVCVSVCVWGGGVVVVMAQEVAAAVLVGVLALHSTSVLAAPGQPHILMIVADDFGYNDVGYHQSTPSAPRPHPANPRGEATTDAAAGVMPTPTLDQLASEGTKLEMYYVQPLCSPTRATFMTGRYPFHTGLGPDVICTSCGDPYGLPARETLMPALLREAGYATAAIGKCACDAPLV